MEQADVMKKIKTMDLILVIIGVLSVLFVIINLMLFDRHGAIPDTLVTCWFTAVLGECGVMGWIKNTKTKWADEQREREVYERLKADKDRREV